jgi:trehalose 6-phosphate phosphatase
VVDDPGAARPLAGAAEVLAGLASRYGLVAVVSGRPAAFLARHLRVAGAPSRLRLIGLYGLESAGPDGTVTALEGADGWRAVVEAAAEDGASELGDPSAVERKGLSVTFHWRRRPELEETVVALVARLAKDTGLVAHLAKMSVELRPPMEVDKGTAVAQLVEGFSAAAFLGDDLGDLPAFAALDVLAAGGARVVKVGVRSEEAPAGLIAAADLLVDGPRGALALLRSLVP